jgi:hypothetical protein
VNLSQRDFWSGVDLEIVTRINDLPIERETEVYNASNRSWPQTRRHLVARRRAEPHV